MLKVEAIIDEVIKGEVTRLRIGDDVYAIKYIGSYEDIEEAVVKQEPKIEDEHNLSIVSGVGIKPSVLKMIQEVGSDNMPIVHEIISKVYPNLTKKSKKKYVQSYIKFINGWVDKKVVKRKPYVRIKKKGKPNSFGYSKKYKIYVMPDDIQKVKLAMNTVRFGYKPTSDAIERETNMKHHRVMATIDVMLNKGMCIKRYENNVPIYQIPLVL